MIPIETKYLKPRSGFLLIGLLPLGVLLYVATQTNGDDKQLMLVFSLIALIPLAMFFFHAKSYVVIDNDGITHKTPFRQRTISWNDVTRSYFKIRHTGKSSQRLWYFENVIGKGLSFTTGLYSRRSLQAIAEALLTKRPDAEIEQKIRNIAEGKFPWYIF